MTVPYLDGNPENMDDTIRKHLYDNWNKAKTLDVVPKFVSGGGEDAEVVDDVKPVSPMDFTLFINRNSITIIDGDDASEDMGPGSTRTVTWLYVNVYGTSTKLLRLFTDEVNRILKAHTPTVSTRIKKTDGKDSAIASFDTLHISFTKSTPYADSGATWGSHGQLGCIWYDV